MESGKISKPGLGDMPVEEFRKTGYEMVDWICDYISDIDSYPVMSSAKPGDIKGAIPENPPEAGESFKEIFEDFKNIIIPGTTHWNHPDFHAYFSCTGSGPAILGELLASSLNINAMLWKSSPAATELEEVVVNWMKQLLNLPDNFFGLITDGGSGSNFIALVAARESINGINIRQVGFTSAENGDKLIVYCSGQTHSSIDKAAVATGIGLKNVRKIETDKNFAMIPGSLEKAVMEDKEKGNLPFAVVSTVGTTSSSAYDPFAEIDDICKKHSLWHHVDASYAGIASIMPEYRDIFKGLENVDSFVTNPHKWLFTTVDASLLFFKDRNKIKNSLSLEAEYLKTKESSETVNFMDYSLQLARGFRALKIWFVLRYFGKAGIINRLREHVRIAGLLKSYIEEDPDFELMAPVPFSLVCFRYNPAGSDFDDNGLEELNTDLMNSLNSTGRIFLSHTKLNDRFTIRFAIGNIKTTEQHINNAWKLIQKTARLSTGKTAGGIASRDKEI